MKVFEDLIEELRDENLLEETVIDLARSTAVTTGGPDRVETPETLLTEVPAADAAEDGASGSGAEPRFNMQPHPPTDEGDFYRKRAIDEVSSLQMVEHIISAIEREHMLMVSPSYDDLEAKKALHRFLQVQDDTTTTDYAEAEFKLMHETEAWNSALSDRDQKISVSNLRRFCENSRPVLSSQALLALGRFYRNALYSELSRAKFDLVMTRLFSRAIDEEKRRMLFGRSEMIGHIKTLYANWSSIALYSADEASSKIRAVVAGFDERLAEAESAETFEQLIKNAFFDKVHEFKEAAGEMFFIPEVVAAAIECNIQIGNKFVDLIQLERGSTNRESVEQKYGYEYDQVISDAAGKTLQMVELLKSLPEVEVPEAKPRAAEPRSVVRAATVDKAPFFKSDLLRVNKWLLVATIVAVIASSGLYFWANQSDTDSSLAESAQDVDLENTEFKAYLRTGRATSETFYAITLPSWDQLTEERQKEILQQVLVFANKNGQKYVQLVNVRGRNVAYASKSRSEILASTY